MNYWLVYPHITQIIGIFLLLKKREDLFYNIENAPLKLPNYLSNEAKSLIKSVIKVIINYLVALEKSC